MYLKQQTLLQLEEKDVAELVDNLCSRLEQRGINKTVLTESGALAELYKDLKKLSASAYALGRARGADTRSPLQQALEANAPLILPELEGVGIVDRRVYAEKIPNPNKKGPQLYRVVDASDEAKKFLVGDTTILLSKSSLVNGSSYWAFIVDADVPPNGVSTNYENALPLMRDIEVVIVTQVGEQK